MERELKNAAGKVFITIAYDAQNNWVYNNWFGYQSRESVMLGADACLEVLAAHNCSYLINDNHLVAGPWSQANEWIAHDWTPRAIAQGLTHMAHVVSPEALARLSAENMSKRVGSSFRMQIFTDAQMAKEWLKQVQEENL